jgi:hypothetical protein
MLVDVLDRSRHLVEGAASEAARGEMAHYTPGVQLIALKAGFVFLIAPDVLDSVRGRESFAARRLAADVGCERGRARFRGTSQPYAIAVSEVLPGEVLRTAEVVRTFKTAVIIKRLDAGC